MAGTLRDQNRPGTLVTDLNETLTLSRLVGRVFPLVKRNDSPPGPIAVGRSSDNDVAISDYSISQRHCHLSLAGPQTTLTDCGSTNGTVVDGKPGARPPAGPAAGGRDGGAGAVRVSFSSPEWLSRLLTQAGRKITAVSLLSPH